MQEQNQKVCPNTKSKEVRCKYCGHQQALELDGELRWYCPKCHGWQITVVKENFDSHDIII